MSKEQPFRTIDHESATLRRKEDKLRKALERVQSNFTGSLSAAAKESLAAALEVVKFGRDIVRGNFTMMNFEGRDYMVKFETPVTFGVDLMRSISTQCAMKRVIPIDIEFVAEEKLLHLKSELDRVNAEKDKSHQKNLTKAIKYVESAISAISILEYQLAYLDGGDVRVEEIDEDPFVMLGRLSEVQHLKSLSAPTADLKKYINDLKLDIKFNSISAIKWDQRLIPDDKISHVLSSAEGDIFGPRCKSDDTVQLSIAEHAGMLAIFGDFDYNPKNFLLSTKTGKVVHIDQSPLVNGFFCNNEILRQHSRVFGSSLTKDFIQIHLARADRDPAYSQVEKVVRGDSDIRSHIDTFLVDYKIDDMMPLLDLIEERARSNPQIKQQFMHFVDTLQKAIELGEDDRLLNSYRDHVVDHQGQIAAARVEMQIAKLKLNTLEARVEYGPLITLAKILSIGDERSDGSEEIKRLYLERKVEIVSIESEIIEVYGAKSSHGDGKTQIREIFDKFDIQSLKHCQDSLFKEDKFLSRKIEMYSKEDSSKKSPNSAFLVPKQESKGVGADTVKVVDHSQGQPSISIRAKSAKLEEGRTESRIFKK